MMARAATGQQTPEESVAEAEAEITAIFDKWRAEGLMGGGSVSRESRSRAVEQTIDASWPEMTWRAMRTRVP